MVNKEVDNALIELNRRYKDAKIYRGRFGWFHSIMPLIGFIRRGKVCKSFRYIRHILYASTHYTTNGNVIYELPSTKLEVEKYRIAVYTCIVGEYDDLVEPLFVDPEVDYFVFTDLECSDSSIWKKIDITQFDEYRTLTPTMLNRKIKMLPFMYLHNYDYSIYIDGNVEIVASVLPLIEEMGEYPLGVHYHRDRDCIYDEGVQIIYKKKAEKRLVKKQVIAYEKEMFPHHYGLYENPILIRKHDDEDVCRLMEEWWLEYVKYPTRDQLSFPYIIWKTRFDRRKIHILGKSWYMNPRFNKIKSHE